MRSEQEMLDLIVDTAQQDERIRAVIMNGSRANPNAPRDPFQDYDIVYVVTAVAPFRQNEAWIKRFGEIMIVQMPDAMQDPPSGEDGSFTYLMQFADGNRIDLNVVTLATLREREQDSLSIVLLDKDASLAPLAPANESDYFPHPPTAKAFADCCNEFWWVCPYVAKGLWRGEILYAKYNHDHYVRDQLMKMIDWTIGLQTQFTQNPSKNGKYYKQYLAPELWEMLQESYADCDYAHTWDALTMTCKLFRRLAIQVAEHYGYNYLHEDDERVSAHLRHVRQLPQDAQEIY